MNTTFKKIAALVAAIIMLIAFQAAALASNTYEDVSGGQWEQRQDGTYYLFNDSEVTGFKIIDGKTYLFDSAGVMQTGWQNANGKNYFLNSDGTLHEGGWLEDGNGRHFINADGSARQAGWLLQNGTWYYLNDADGGIITGFTTVGAYTYYFDENGAMQTGWQNVDGKNYFLSSGGVLRSGGWLLDNGNWHFLNPDGSAKSGWLLDKGFWYYLNDIDGRFITGFKTVDGYTYFFSSGGVMRKGWLTTDQSPAKAKSQEGQQNTYYLNSGGVLQRGWRDIDGNTYYFDDNGAMLTGSHTIDGRAVTFAADGSLTSGTPRHKLIEAAIANAESAVGCPYALGAKGPSRFDCSGLTWWVYNKAGLNWNYINSSGQYTATAAGNTPFKIVDGVPMGKNVISNPDESKLEPGDILFFRTSSSRDGSTGITHVGLYVGGPEGTVIHASSSAGRMTKLTFDQITGYSSMGYKGAMRLK
jgi:glucan-binding YG repeat protein